MNQKKNSVKIYLYYVGQEFLQWKTYITWHNYIVPFVVGISLNLVEHGQVAHSGLPYLLPFVVQIFTKALSRFRHRHQSLLAKLPARRDEPVFIMNSQGDIISSTGKTSQYFKEKGISNILQLLDNKTEVLAKIAAETNGLIEVYIESVSKWYQIKFTRERDADYFIWFENISVQKKRDQGLDEIINFHTRLATSLDGQTDPSILLEQLSHKIISLGYEGIFITRNLISDFYVGKTYKLNDRNELEKSKEITIHKDAHNPILLSRKQGDVIWANSDEYSIQQEFEKKFPFDQGVKEFLSKKIDNFISYHSGNISIIAFNKKEKVDAGDELVINALVGSTRSLVNLIDKNRDNEELFFASISGLCAASEYSDEITGQHVWRVNEYSRFLAKKIGMSDEDVNMIGNVAALHDIGKVAIPHLIKFEGAYTDEQRKQMQMHTIFGAGVIDKMIEKLGRDFPALSMARDIALHHHQAWNGEGYPGLKNNNLIDSADSQDCNYYQNLTPLKGEDIPISALIAGIADAYDALRSKRQYKPEFSHEKTVAILSLDDRTGISGEDRFGPVVWGAFKSYHQGFAEIFTELYS